FVVGRAHEPLERGERPAGEHVEVGDLAGGERQPLQRLDALRPLARPVDELAAVRGDQVVGRHGAHALTAALTRPSRSSASTMIRAVSSGSSVSVSTTISGLSGSSYGSSTPVKPLISPANAFA